MITVRGVLAELGCLLIQFGEFDRSQDALRESLSMCLELGADVSWELMASAFLANARGQPRRAVRLLGASENLRKNTGEQLDAQDRPAYDGALASLRSQMDSAAFDAAWVEGSALTEEQAVALAMSEEP